MARIFISYRREQAAFVATAIHRELEKRFGKTSVFLDTHAIAGGSDFLDRIEREIRECRVVLVVMQEGWAEVTDASGRRRLDQPDDVVRRELELAIEQDKEIVPLLIDAARMPGPGRLPPSLAPLARRNGMQVRPGLDFQTDVERITRVIEPAPRNRTVAVRTMAVMAMVAAAVTLAWIVWRPRQTMVTVPAGSFIMGCNQRVDHECAAEETPAHEVDLDAFSIDRTETTVAEYSECVRAGACTVEGVTLPFWNGTDHPEGQASCNWGLEGRSNHPMNCLTWEQARTYCAWAKKRLPTEEQWEKAARDRDGRKYPWGNDAYETVGAPVANVADEAANRELSADWKIDGGYVEGYDDGYGGTAPVGSFPAGASPYGALDMVGNVWEWVDGGAPSGRVVRGGSWYDLPSFARTSSRDVVPAVNRLTIVGMRCAR
jgi:formylglycine-generating enzyme required for sulfatase activity